MRELITILKKMSAESLLAVGGFYIFVVAGVFLLLQPVPSFDGQMDMAEVANKNIGVYDLEEIFALGQYYFNHDDDPGGPYDLQRARLYYTELLKRDPEAHALAWYQLGRIDFLEGKFDSAIYKFYKQTQYFGDTIPNVHYMLGLTYGYRAREYDSQTDWENAENEFKKFIAFDPTSPWARTDLSWIYFSQGKYEEIKSIVEEGLVYRPDSPWLLNMYGLALLNTGEKGEAHIYFLRAKEEAEKLTIEEWGKAYPGNDPSSWQTGLGGMRTAIEHNVDISSSGGI